MDRFSSKIWQIKELQIYNLVDPRASTLRQSDNVGNCSRGFYRLAATGLNLDFQKQWSIQYLSLLIWISKNDDGITSIEIVHMTMR